MNQAIPHRERDAGQILRSVLWAAVLPLFFLWQECIVRIFIIGNATVSFFTFVLPYCCFLGLILTVLSSFLPRRGERIAQTAVMSVATLIYLVHFLYFRFFSSFFTWEMVGNGGDALTKFWRETVMTALRSWYAVLLILAPLVLYCVFGGRISSWRVTDLRERGFCALGALCLLICTLLGFRLDSSEFGNSYYHGEGFSMSDGVQRFGLTDASLTDLRYYLFGHPQPKENGGSDTDVPPDSVFVWHPVTEPSTSDTIEPPVTDDVTTDTDTAPQPDPDPIPTGVNVLDIDFDALIASAPNEDVAAMHEYFSSLTPTPKNRYTGMFRGKNLIYITAEAFTSVWVTPELTPTLYRMLNSGVVMKDMYNSTFGGSTASGEFADVTGLFYYYGCEGGVGKVWNYVGDHQTYLPFTAGNMLRARGYTSYAFHNYLGSYYGRAGSHPLLGYTFLAQGCGLEGLTSSWPNSDQEMAALSLPYFIDSEQPFSVYYMTVSGHGYYGFHNNAMARKNRDRVENLPYSEEVRSYIAANLELEDMLTTLVDALRDAGKLDDTVFVLTADHYPYALSSDALAELYGLSDPNGMEKGLDIYRTGGFIWCSSMEEPIVVDQPCSTLDLLPTVLNLFGCPYDSRLLMGTDLLSGADTLVILNQNGTGSAWNWINRYGCYMTSTKQFTPAAGVEFDPSLINSYVKGVNRMVTQKRTYSPKILYQNYYRYFQNAIESAQSGDK